MASIGRFALSLASGVQETSFALANLNLDFAMVRLEAPIEFQGLGTSLSKRRRQQAEEGSVHMTARRLGALFADDLPAIPNLTRAYGLRVSEIAENPSFNPIGNPADGPLANHVGADGTSIWAAATSGRGALQIHLLACLLARMWPAPEAISIWSELVSARKTVLRERLNGVEFQITALTASQIDISRDKLAEWDASARSWLRTADKAKLLQQKQLMLIVDNIGLPIHSHPQVYETVIEVWSRAMSVVDKIVAGVAQRVENPEVLLGLSAWHIYPDMAFLGRETTIVEQKDKLVQKGGLVTVGMQSANPENDRGISWTMPLAQLQYYGKPTLSKGAIEAQSIRVSFDNIVQVAIGSIASTWGNHGSDFEIICQFLEAIWRCLKRSTPNGSGSFNWHELFGRQAERFLRGDAANKKEILRFVNLGRRRFASFMAPEPDLAPAYGLCAAKNFFPFLNTEGQIQLIRRMAHDYDIGVDLLGSVMVYRHQHATLEYASVLPDQVPNSKEMHRRWIAPIAVKKPITVPNSGRLQHMASLPDFELWPSNGKYVFDSVKTVKRSIEIMTNTGELCGFISSCTITDQRGNPVEMWHATDATSLRWNRERGVPNYQYLQSVADVHHGSMQVRQINQAWKLASKPHSYENVLYLPLFGAETVMVYHPVTQQSDKEVLIPLRMITEHINSGALDVCLVKYFSLPGLREGISSNRHRRAIDDDVTTLQRQSPQNRSLAALYRASLVYQRLPHADVDLSVTAQPLHTAKWAQITGQSALTISRPEAFACVAMFDTSYVDLDPKTFIDVMAISSGDTLYVSEMLLNDPSQSLTELGIRCLVGNIGRPGMALLLSPRNPMLPEPGVDTWSMVNHESFDGKLEDNFRGISLQLSLTGYDMVINVGEHGRRDKETFYVEAIVQAYEHGKWVGDIDILSMYRDSIGVLSDFGSAVLRGMSIKGDGRTERALPQSCQHTSNEMKNSADFGYLTSIDNWSEFLDPPPNAAVIRAKGNWTARLALAAAMRNRGDSFLISVDQICWMCAKVVADSLGMNSREVLVLC